MLDESLKDKELIIVEDIVDSGRTLAYLVEMLKDRGPIACVIAADLRANLTDFLVYFFLRNQYANLLHLLFR